MWLPAGALAVIASAVAGITIALTLERTMAHVRFRRPFLPTRRFSGRRGDSLTHFI
jgi:hypothetical protein